MTQGTRTGVVSFIGAGPGAADLMTLRGARRIAEADIVLWTPSLVSPECVREHVSGDAELIDTTGSSSQEVLEVCRRAERERLRVARVYSGDAVLWSAVQQQYDACSRMELTVEVVPGVAGHSAAAASVGRELTGSAEEYSVWLGKPDGDWNAMPGAGDVREFAEHGATMALSVSASRAGQLVERLRAGGYEDDVPVVVAYKVTCPDELVLRTTLGEVADLVKRHRLWRHTLFLVGHALQPTSTRSRPYGSASSRWGPGAGASSSASASSRRDGYGRRSARGEQVRTDSSAETSRRASGVGPGDDALLSRSRGDEQRGGSRAEAEVAWWAVRDWQRNARDGIVRADVRGSHGRRAEQDAQAPDLFTTAQDPEVLEGFGTARAGTGGLAAASGETSGDNADQASPVQVSSVDEAASAEQNAEKEVSAEAVAEQDVAEQDRADGSTETEPVATEAPSSDSAVESRDPSGPDSATADSGGTGSGPSDSGAADPDGEGAVSRNSGQRNSGGSRAKQQSSTKQQASKTGSRTGAARSSGKSSGKSSGTKTAGRGKTQRKTTNTPSESEEGSSRSGQSSQRSTSGSPE